MVGKSVVIIVCIFTNGRMLGDHANMSKCADYFSLAQRLTYALIVHEGHRTPPLSVHELKRSPLCSDLNKGSLLRLNAHTLVAYVGG